eukprot:scaffold1804_cov263-Pinguiococcus_pyrenoidosus.AAC.33
MLPPTHCPVQAVREVYGLVHVLGAARGKQAPQGEIRSQGEAVRRRRLIRTCARAAILLPENVGTGPISRRREHRQHILQSELEYDVEAEMLVTSRAISLADQLLRQGRDTPEPVHPPSEKRAQVHVVLAEVAQQSTCVVPSQALQRLVPTEHVQQPARQRH